MSRRIKKLIGNRVVGNPFAIDWHNKEAVIAYAMKFGIGMTVYKRPDRNNYNITHTARTDLYEPEWVIYQTA